MLKLIVYVGFVMNHVRSFGIGTQNVRNADMMLEVGTISRVHPIIDWFLYGVDLIEIVSIINVGMIMFSLLKKRNRKS